MSWDDEIKVEERLVTWYRWITIKEQLEGYFWDNGIILWLGCYGGKIDIHDKNF